jgi:membrane associated rhomboid family serine protease
MATSQNKPYANYAIILICFLVYVFLQQGFGNIPFTYSFALVPAEITQGIDITETFTFRDSVTGNLLTVPHQRAPFGVYFNLISSMFLHFGLMHLISNLMFIWAFGESVEKALGHLRYVLFFLGCGIVAHLTQVFVDPNSQITIMGASGAGAGVLGGYLYLNAKQKLDVELFGFPFKIPVYLTIVAWIFFQVASAYVLPFSVNTTAYFAHIGGVFAGVIMAKVSRKKEA